MYQVTECSHEPLLTWILWLPPLSGHSGQTQGAGAHSAAARRVPLPQAGLAALKNLFQLHDDCNVCGFKTHLSLSFIQGGFGIAVGRTILSF